MKKTSDNSTIRVQQATTEDVNSIQKLCFSLINQIKQWSTTLDENWVLRKEGEEYLRSCIINDNSVVLKAYVNNKITGFVIGSISKKPYRLERKFADIDFFFIDPAYRRQGIATALIKKFFQWCQKHRVKVIRVETTYANEVGQMFYYNNGFHKYELVLEKNL